MAEKKISTIARVRRTSTCCLMYLYGIHRVVHVLYTDVIVYRTVATFQTANSNGVDGRDSRNSFSLAKQEAQLPSRFWKELWLKASSFSWIVSFNSGRDRNWRLRRAARIQVETTPTEPSTKALSLRLRGWAGRMAVL